MKQHFRTRRGPSNLLRYQRMLLRTFRKHQEFIVVPTDKNLGPTIMERAQYIRRIQADHLSDLHTYRRLSKQEANDAISATHTAILALLDDQYSSFLDADSTFIRRSLDVSEPLSAFYALIKIHKDPIVTRPIISQSGSILHGLGRWTDQQLQPFCRKLSSYINSSFALIVHLKNLQLDRNRTYR